MGMYDNLHPAFNDKLNGLLGAADAEGINLRPLSGYRSEEDQRRAIDQVAQRNRIPLTPDLYQRGIPGMAAPVGLSHHQRGAAMDWDVSNPDTKKWLYANAQNHGLHFPLPNSDSGHMQMLGGPAGHAHASGGQPSQQGQQAMPQRDDERGGMGGLLGGIGNFVGALNRGVQSPLFQSGAAMFNAGAEGKNIGGGFMAAGQAGATASQHAALLEKARREQLAQQQRDVLWGQIDSANPPEWAKGLPSGTLGLAKMLGPDAGTSLITGLMTKNADGSLERDKLKEQSRYHDSLAETAKARMMEAQATNVERQELMRANAEASRQKVQEARDKADRRRQMFGDPAEAPPSPQGNPNIRPQSYDPPPDSGDPNIIRTQAVQPQPQVPPLPPQPAAPPQKTYQVGREMLPADQARARLTPMLTDPELRPYAAHQLKQIDQDHEDRGFDKAAKGDIEKKLVGQVDHLSRLNNLESRHGQNIEKFMNVPYRMKSEWVGLNNKMGAKLSKDQVAERFEYVQFRADSARNLNELIKEMAGSAVTQSEAARTLLAEPNAGGGGMSDFITGDAPVDFIAKLKSGQTAAKLAIARKNFLRNARGLTDDQISELAKKPGAEDLDGVSLPGMRGIMLRERNRVEGQFRARNPNVEEQKINDAVKQHMQGAFGI